MQWIECKLYLDYAHDQRFERLSTLLMLSVIE